MTTPDAPNPPDAPRPRTLSLRLQVALLLAFATLPVGVLAVAQGYAAFSDTRELRRSALASAALKETVREQGLILEAFGVIDAFKSQITPDMPPEACTERLRAFVDGDQRVSFMGVVGKDGVMRCGFPLSAPLNVSGRPEYERFLNAPRRTVTVYQVGPISNVPVVVASTPIWRGEELVGSIAVSLPSAYINWAKAPERHEASRFAIVDGTGTTIAKTEGEAETTWLPDMQALHGMMKHQGHPTVAVSASGESRIYSVKPLFKRDIYAVSSWPVGEVEKQWTMPQILALMLPIVMWGLAVIVGYFAVDRFALRHVVYLDRLVSAYARSGRSLRASGMRDAPLEFAALGDSFDRMALEIEKREDALRHSIDEKDALLKEVYHRVRNNLQMIVSLMNLQLRTAESEQERETLQQLQDRILGLAAMHNRLSESEKVNAIRIDALLKEIVENARETRAADGEDIALKFDLIECTEGPDRALPLALFTTEAVGNAFKHGLGRGGKNALRLVLRDAGPDTLELLIVNAHRGLPAHNTAVGLGSQLIDSFARQLRGKVTRTVTTERYTLSLVFPRDQTCPAVNG